MKSADEGWSVMGTPVIGNINQVSKSEHNAINHCFNGAHFEDIVNIIRFGCAAVLRLYAHDPDQTKWQYGTDHRAIGSPNAGLEALDQKHGRRLWIFHRTRLLLLRMVKS
ncbi:hypothetical protein [Agrobacterium rubi]|uniref:hypothetical protein n=1 Tax=Agrobacterium rubi TaxID=28099 RepID=UPI00201B61C8|nr:hypothetical protein [Agrobacterium rubi]